MLASPASADPEDGEGCVGLQSRPAAYVCLIALDPAAVPAVEQTGTTTLFDDNVCYLAGCRRVTVTAPTLGLAMPSSPVLVVYYNGTYHSVSLAGAPSAPPTDGYADTALRLAIPVAGGLLFLGDALLGDAVLHDAGVHLDNWFDCTVESETNDEYDPIPEDTYSGFTAMSCTTSYIL